MAEQLPKTWLGPAATRRLLGLTATGLDYLIRTGRLEPQRDAEGVRRFDEAAVERLAAERKRAKRSSRSEAGILAARAFEILDEGRDWRDVVRELECEPQKARELAEQHRSDRHLVLAPVIVERLVELGLAGPDGVVRAQTIVGTLEAARERVRQLRVELREARRHVRPGDRGAAAEAVGVPRRGRGGAAPGSAVG